MIPPSLRAFIAGVSGSGKSSLAWQMYLSRFPRVILLDMTGEWTAPDPARDFPGPDLTLDTVRQLAHAMRLISHRGKWIVTVELDPEEMPSLVDWLIPIPSPRARSPVPMLGGVALLVDEVDMLSAQGTASEHIRTLYRRSRHVGLSIISATQRPENVGREVSAQSNQAVMLTIPEPRGRDYMARLMRLDPERMRQHDRWTAKHRHGGMWRNLQTGEVRWIPDRGPLVKDRGPQTDLLADRGDDELPEGERGRSGPPER